MAEKYSPLDGRNGKAPWQTMNKVFGSRTAEEHAAHLVPFIQPYFRILDVGCGLGSITMDFAALVPDGEVYGIDTNPETTRLAIKAAETKKVENVKFEIGDAHDLSEIEDDYFDVVHAHQVMLYVPNPVKALREMRRVLKTGGYLSLRDNHQFLQYPNPLKDREWFVRMTLDRGGDPHAGARTHVWVHEAGFPWSNIQTSCAAWEVSKLESKRIFAGAAKNSFRTVGLPAGYGTAAEYDEVAEQWERWAVSDESRLSALDGVVLAWK